MGDTAVTNTACSWSHGEAHSDCVNTEQMRTLHMPAGRKGRWEQRPADCAEVQRGGCSSFDRGEARGPGAGVGGRARRWVWQERGNKGEPLGWAGAPELKEASDLGPDGLKSLHQGKEFLFSLSC